MNGDQRRAETMLSSHAGDDADEHGDVGTEPGWGWVFVRASAVVLFVLMPVQVLGALVSSDVASTTAETMSHRWDNPALRAVDWVVLVLGIAHGACALTRAVSSSGLSPRVRGALDGVLWALAGLLIALGTFVALTYEIA